MYSGEFRAAVREGVTFSAGTANIIATIWHDKAARRGDAKARLRWANLREALGALRCMATLRLMLEPATGTAPATHEAHIAALERLNLTGPKRPAASSNAPATQSLPRVLETRGALARARTSAIEHGGR